MVATGVESVASPASREVAPVELARALGDPLRWRIVELLSTEQLCVAYLAEELQTAQPLVSHHLKVLRAAGLIEPGWSTSSPCSCTGSHASSSAPSPKPKEPSSKTSPRSCSSVSTTPAAARWPPPSS